MDNNAKPDYDAMFRSSQQPKYPNPKHTALSQDAPLPPHGQREQTQNEVLHGEVLDATGRPLQAPRRVSAEALGFVSLIIGVAAFILIFVGMFFRFFMWLNILLCLTGIGFGIAALLKPSSGAKIIGIIGVGLCIFDLLAEVICMLIVAITAGISAIFHLFV